MTTYTLGDTLSNDSNGADLGELHQLHGGLVDGTGRGEVDDGVDVGVLGESLLGVLVDRQEGLAGTPVHLADELATEGVDDTGDGGGGTLADEVKVEHALHGSGLHAAGKRVSSVLSVHCVWRFLPSDPGGSSASSQGVDLLYEASCLVVEKGVLEGSEDTARRGKTGDVVVGRLSAVVGCSSHVKRGSRHDESVNRRKGVREGVVDWVDLR